MQIHPTTVPRLLIVRQVLAAKLALMPDDGMHSEAVCTGTTISRKCLLREFSVFDFKSVMRDSAMENDTLLFLRLKCVLCLLFLGLLLPSLPLSLPLLLLPKALSLSQGVAVDLSVPASCLLCSSINERNNRRNRDSRFVEGLACESKVTKDTSRALVG
jgi:hypothetical protein